MLLDNLPMSQAGCVPKLVALISKLLLTPAYMCLRSWIWRGFFLGFESLLTLEITGTAAPGSTELHKSLQLYRFVSAVSLLVCAALYVLGGILCFGRRKQGRPALSSSCSLVAPRLLVPCWSSIIS